MDKITCIIVDNEKQARDRLESLINKSENISLSAVEGDPNLAIEKIIRNKPDIVFLEIEMPVKNGFDVVREVRANHVFPTFIFVSGCNQYTIKAIKNAVFDYLLKPIDIDELKETIERFKNQHKLKISSETYNLRSIPLSKREKEILQLIIEGKTSKEIAEQICISKNTVDTHRRNIIEKTGKKSTAELIGFAINTNLKTITLI